MALTVTIVNRTQTGNRRRRVVDVAWDTSYATGGKSFTAGDVELTNIDTVVHSHTVAGGAASIESARYDGISKLAAIAASGAEVANAFNNSSRVSRLVVEGQ